MSFRSCLCGALKQNPVLLFNSPKQCWLEGQRQGEESDALAFGAAYHCALLEPAVYAETYVVQPSFGDCRKKENKAARDAWRAENKGKKPVELADARRIEAMAKALREHPRAGKLLVGGDPELTLLWNDAETGVRCRARADYYLPKLDVVVDVKTTADASEPAFSRDVFRYRYHWQHALYRGGFAACGEKPEHFVFIAQEKEPPYAIGIYQLDDAGVSAGHRRVRDLLMTMGECIATDKWDAYDTRIQTLSTPTWAA
jgi:exodeoxyribonuclease VIII